MQSNATGMPILDGKHNVNPQNNVEYQDQGMRFAVRARDEVET